MGASPHQRPSAQLHMALWTPWSPLWGRRFPLPTMTTTITRTSVKGPLLGRSTWQALYYMAGTHWHLNDSIISFQEVRSPGSKREVEGRGHPVRKRRSQGRLRPGSFPTGLCAHPALPLKAPSGGPVRTQEGRAGVLRRGAITWGPSCTSLPPGSVHLSLLPGPSQSIRAGATEPGPQDGQALFMHTHARACT